MRVGIVAAAALALAGCASSSKEITATYVSPLTYQNYDCQQIVSEQQRVAARATQLGGQVDQNATDDAVVTGVGAVLFWPALFFLNGDGPQAQEYAHLKGENDALQQAAIAKKCSLRETENPTTAPAAPPAQT